MLLRRQEFEPTSSFLDFLHLGTCTDCPRNQRTPNDSIYRECLLYQCNNSCKLYNYLGQSEQLLVCNWLCVIVIKTVFVPLAFCWPCKMATAMNRASGIIHFFSANYALKS